MDLPPGQWLWVSIALHCGLPWMIIWPEPYSSCCGFIPKKLHDPQGLMSLRTWFWPSWMVGHCPEPLHWWMWLEVPWLIRSLAHFLPFGKAHLGLVAGLFPPNVGGLWHKPGSFEAASANSPGCQISYPGVEGTGPCPGSGMLVAQSSQSLLGGVAPHFWYLKDNCTFLVNFWMSSWLGTYQSSCHHDGIFHMLCMPVDPPSSSLGGRLRHWGLLGVIFQSVTGPRHFFLCKELLDKRVQSRQALEVFLPVLGSGLDQSDGFSVPFSSPQVRRGGPLALVSSPGLILKCYLLSWLHGSGGLGLSSGWLPLACFYLGDFGLMAPSPGSLLMAAQMSMAPWALVPMAKRVA